MAYIKKIIMTWNLATGSAHHNSISIQQDWREDNSVFDPEICQRAIWLSPDVKRIFEDTKTQALEEIGKLDSISEIEKAPILDNCINSIEAYGIEAEDFRIDSTWWCIIWEDKEFKINPEWDIWESLTWPNKWTQYFLKAAAIRETTKAKKKIPTKKDWFRILNAINPNIKYKTYYQNDWSIKAKLKIWNTWYHCSSSWLWREKKGAYYMIADTGRACLIWEQSIDLGSEDTDDNNGKPVRCLSDLYMPINPVWTWEKVLSILNLRK